MVGTTLEAGNNEQNKNFLSKNLQSRIEMGQRSKVER